MPFSRLKQVSVSFWRSAFPTGGEVNENLLRSEKLGFEQILSSEDVIRRGRTSLEIDSRSVSVDTNILRRFSQKREWHMVWPRIRFTKPLRCLLKELITWYSFQVFFTYKVHKCMFKSESLGRSRRARSIISRAVLSPPIPSMTTHWF
jgi:hypothetical protein